MNNLLKNINVRYCLYLIRLKEEMIYMNKYVYSLEHKKKINKKIYDIKFIGWFSTKKKAKQVRKEYKKLPGFKDTSRDFMIKKYKVNKIIKLRKAIKII